MSGQSGYEPFFGGTIARRYTVDGLISWRAVPEVVMHALLCPFAPSS